jgi:hypothetical protein
MCVPAARPQVAQHRDSAGQSAGYLLDLTTTKMYLKPHLPVVNRQNLTRSRTQRCEWSMFSHKPEVGHLVRREPFIILHETVSFRLINYTMS